LKIGSVSSSITCLSLVDMSTIDLAYYKRRYKINRRHIHKRKTGYAARYRAYLA
jgi:hypothetical protein